MLICPNYLMLPCDGRNEQNIFLHTGFRYLILRISLGFSHTLNVLVYCILVSQIVNLLVLIVDFNVLGDRKTYM